MTPNPARMHATLRWIAAFEALKGLAALAGLAGLLSLLHHDIRRLALELIGHFDLEPTQHYPALLLQGVDRINATPVHSLVLLALAYVATRWIEAWGLWHDKVWGETFGALAGAIYVPFEIKHLMHSPSWQSAAVLIFNLILVAVLLVRLRQRQQSAPQMRNSATE